MLAKVSEFNQIYAPVGHGNLKKYPTDQREWRRKMIPLRVNPVERYRLLYQRILEDPFESPSCTREKPIFHVWKAR